MRRAGTTTIAGDLVTTNSNISVNNALAITSNANVSTGSGTVVFASTVTFGSQMVSISADEIDFAGNVSGSGGSLTLSPGTTGAAMQIGGVATAANRLDLTPTEFSFIQPGLASLTFGRADSAAAVTINTIAFSAPTAINAGSVALTVSGAVTSTANLRLVTGSGGIALNGCAESGAEHAYARLWRLRHPVSGNKCTGIGVAWVGDGNFDAGHQRFGCSGRSHGRLGQLR